MKQRLIPCHGLTETHLTAIHHLKDLCNAADGLTMKLNPRTLRNRPTDQVNDFLMFDGDVLVGFLALYAFNKQEAEVSAMTHPHYRRRGIFKELLAAACEETARRQIPDLLFICERASPAAGPVMAAIGAAYDFSEYKMILQQFIPTTNPVTGIELQPASPPDLDKLVEIDLISFSVKDEATRDRLKLDFASPNRRIWTAVKDGEIVGKIHASTFAGEAYIHGFALLPPHRGRGYGQTILSRTVARLVVEHHDLISLEVETENESALSLYRRIGFEVATAYDYYRMGII